MLSKIALDAPFRSLTPDTFDNEITFGKRTIIYGHNGSGKSSLSELLHQLSTAQYPGSLSWTDDKGNRTKIAPGEVPPAVSLSVFTKSWVEENLAEFLEGHSAAAIVMLGAEAIGAKEEQERIERELKKLEKDRPDSQKDLSNAESATKALVSSVPERFLRQLTFRLGGHQKV